MWKYLYCIAISKYSLYYISHPTLDTGCEHGLRAESTRQQGEGSEATEGEGGGAGAGGPATCVLLHGQPGGWMESETIILILLLILTICAKVGGGVGLLPQGLPTAKRARVALDEVEHNNNK